MDVQAYIETLLKGEILNERQCRLLCDKVKEILLEESNVHPIDAPVIVCGDIHGQFYDLLKLFDLGGPLPSSRYIFLGDYVDRGNHSVETVLLLLCYKVAYPGDIFLLRGNHESRLVTQTYGFYLEIMKKYGNHNPWRMFMDVFDHFPLAATIEGKIFCVHGGLSPDISSIEQIRMINRKMEIPQSGPFSDLMWSDPDDKIETWMPSERGAGWYYGWKAVDHFNYLNDIELVCRAHQLAMDGFRYSYARTTLLTVWSAPNYYYRCGNKASILKISRDLERTFEIFEADSKSTMQNGNPKDVLPYFL